MNLLSTDIASRVPPTVQDLCVTLRDAGFRAWVVGGCTRDLLLGRDVHDWDLATDALPEEVSRVFRRVVPTGIQHGTVTVMVGKEGFEVTTLRGDGAYSDGRRPDSVTFVRDLHEDLARRDFTMNAIAFDPLTGTLSDPFDGQSDLGAKLIRAVGDPSERFNEDGLRVMRAARFCSTLAFDIEPGTLLGMAAATDTLRRVSAERIRDELLKTLGGPIPSRGLRAMLDTGVLGVVLPEVLPMVGCEQNRYHAFDVWDHTLACVDACKPDTVLRFAVLLHDVGKPETREHSEKTNDFTFYHHEVAGADTAARIATRLKLSGEERARVVHVVRQHLIPYEDDWSDAAVRRWVRRVDPSRVADVLEVANADAMGKGVDPQSQLELLARLGARVNALAAEGMALSARDLAVDGRDIMSALGLAPGPWVGKVLAHLVELVVDDPSVNEPERLLDHARQYLEASSADLSD